MEKLLAWGANSHGQLGCGNCEDQDYPLVINCNLNGSVQKITGGGGHSLLLTDIGSIYSSGNNDCHQLGRCSDSNTIFLEVQQNFSPSCKAIAAGWDFSLALTSEGSLLVWGSNSFSQLGTDKQCHPKFNCPIVLDNIPKRLGFIAAGLRHTAVISESGLVYAWGFNAKCQVAETSTRVISNATSVDLCGELADKVVCGSSHTAALTTRGEVFVWGSNSHGQCAQNSQTVKIVQSPVRINPALFHDEKVIDLHSGWTHLMAVTESGHIYTWGRACYGQLGRYPAESTPQSDHQPGRTGLLVTPALSRSHLVCGSEHCLVSPDSRSLISWGWNEHGMCAVERSADDCVWAPNQISRLPEQVASVARVGCGAGHCFAVVNYC